MSWMDSWSRPSKSQATPAPYYLLPGGDATPYCRTCGRVISSRKANAPNKTSKKTSQAKAETKSETKYCSSRCRGQKPGKLDKQIEEAFVRFLQGEDHSAEILKKAKGDGLVLVPCDAVERKIFGDRKDPSKIFGRRKNRATRVIERHSSNSEEDVLADDHQSPNHDPGADVIDELAGSHRLRPGEFDSTVDAGLSVRSGTRVRPPQTQSQVNGSVGGEKGRAERIEETEEMKEKRADGQKRAREREMVRCAARRGVIFGFIIDGDEQRRKCEAVMQGNVVEPSFAKGNWSVRWRED